MNVFDKVNMYDPRVIKIIKEYQKKVLKLQAREEKKVLKSPSPRGEKNVTEVEEINSVAMLFGYDIKSLIFPTNTTVPLVKGPCVWSLI